MEHFEHPKNKEYCFFDIEEMQQALRIPTAMVVSLADNSVHHYYVEVFENHAL
mgnify:CR=1 FL=1